MSNIQPYIILNDIDSRTISGLLISSLPPISKPQVRTQVETVDGRDGDLVTPLGFSAYDKVITIGLTYGYDIDDVIEYFNSEGVVVFSNEPDKFYRYAIYEQIDFDKLIRFKKAEVTLHCQPFKFSTTEAPIVRNGSGAGISANVVNSGNIYSRPELLLTGSGNATVDLNSSEILSVDLDSANGAIFIDSENMNAYGANSAINNVIAYINPVQDLHGYSKPWSGGGGKNKLEPCITSGTLNGITYTVNDDGTIKLSDTATNESKKWGFFDLKAGSYIYTSGVTESLDTYDTFLSIGDTTIARGISGYNSFTLAQDSTIGLTIRVRNGITPNVTIKPMIRLASVSDATFEPYENICEITGFTELNIIDNGVNQWNEEWELGIYNMTTGLPQPSNFSIRGKNRIIVKPNTTYYANNNLIRRLYYDFNDNFISSKGGGGADTTPSNCCFMRIYLADTYGTTYNNDISINYPATDTSYHAYDGNTYTVDISENPQDPDNPQVVYGGYYESKTGLMIINKQIVDLGTLNYTYYSNCMISDTLSMAGTVGAAGSSNPVICEAYETRPTRTTISNYSDKQCGLTIDGTQLIIKDSSYTNAATFKTAMSGVHLVYELAEPIQIQLAPTQINNLIGLNQVFTDTNGDVAVDYRASGEAHFEQAPIVSFTCTFEDIIKGTLLNRAVTGNYDNIKLNIGLNNLVVNGSGVKQLAIDKYSRWL